MKEGWEIKKLGEVCKISPPKSEVRSMPLNADDYVSFLPMEDLCINKKYFSASKQKALSEVASGYTYFVNDDVLLAKVTPCFENGKVGVAKNMTNGVGFGSSEYIVLRADKSKVLADYIYYILNSNDFRLAGATLMTGASGLKRLPKPYVSDYLVSLPSLSEQQRIVTILDTAFAKVDAMRSNAERNLQSAKDLFQAALKQELSPKEGWVSVLLPEISQNLDSRRTPITKGNRISGMYPYYGASGIVDYVGDFIFDDELLLISEDGANLLARSTPIAFSVSGKTWVNNHAHVLKFNNLITQRYVELYFQSIKIDKYVTGAAQPKLNQKSLNSIPINIPNSLIEQECIVNLLENLQTNIMAISINYQQTIEHCQALKQAILTNAFNGEL